MKPLREWLGWQGTVAVPILDGPLKPNQRLETATVVASLDEPMDLACDARGVLVADGREVLRVAGDSLERVLQASAPITAMACVAGGIALALDGRSVRMHGGPLDGREWTSAGLPFNAVNALSAQGDGALLVTDGSQARPFAQWKHDLMELGSSGALHRIELASNAATTLASGLGYAFGAVQAGSDIWVSESWRHRLTRIGGSRGYPLSRLPAYPSRLTRSPTGGYWLTLFACRTQLVELILREHDYRRAMIREVDPEYWVAPALSAGNSFLEPLQGASVKQMGVIKPWAPPRAYGLVARLSEEGRPRYSLHSRVDGRNHGVVAAVEFEGFLYVLAKGARRLLRVPLDEMPPEFGA